MSTQQLTTTNQPQPGALQAAYGAFSTAVLREQVNLIQQAMAEVMKDGHHYGLIPGCGPKPALLKPGAEKLCFLFRLAPEYKVDVIDLGGGHREYRVVCRLVSIQTGAFIGEGVGSCSTMESKYRYRDATRKCPQCGKAAIIKGKAEYGGGWVCFKKKDGCGAKFSDGDPAVESQPAGKTENPDVADVYNTCLKMAKKRASVDATLTATAASDIFAQDIEEFADAEPADEPAARPQRPAKAEVQQPQQPDEPDAKPAKPPWKQLSDRIDATDALCAEKGWYGPGVLKAEVEFRAGQAGFPARMADWSAEQITQAAGWAKAIKADGEQRAAERAAQQQPQQQPPQQAPPAPATPPPRQQPAPAPAVNGVHVNDEAEARRLVGEIDAGLRRAGKLWLAGLKHVGVDRLPSGWPEPADEVAARAAVLGLLAGGVVTIYQLRRLAKEMEPKGRKAPGQQPAA